MTKSPTPPQTVAARPTSVSDTDPAAPAGTPDPVPTRIRDLAPLLVRPSESPVKEQIVESLEELAVRMAGVHAVAAEGWIGQGEYERALPHLITSVTFAPQEVSYLGQLGFVRYVTGDDQGAAESYQAILEIDAKNADAWFSLGMIAFGKQDHAAAETCFRRSVESNADDPQAWNNLGVCLFQQERAEDARICFQKALEIDPDDEDAKFNLDNLA